MDNIINDQETLFANYDRDVDMNIPFSIIVSKEINELKQIILANQGISNSVSHLMGCSKMYLRKGIEVV